MFIKMAKQNQQVCSANIYLQTNISASFKLQVWEKVSNE